MAESRKEEKKKKKKTTTNLRFHFSPPGWNAVTFQ
jgi:hypothetical protein